jgi:radical SAM protein (TIGR04043 family)
MKGAGIDRLGMHLEVVTPALRAEIMPGKAQAPLPKYFDSFGPAVEVFGWGQVSTYILAGLGDSAEAILEMSERLCAIGVYPFVAPFVPVSGTPLESHPAPSSAFMASVLASLSGMARRADMRAGDIKAGCGKRGACSALSANQRLAAS